MRRRMVTWVGVGVIVVIGLAACGGSDSGTSTDIVLIEDEPTSAAQSSVPTVTRTPVPTNEPFVLPTLEPELDPQMPVTRVGSTVITLEDYQKTVRFERFSRLYSLALIVEKRGTETVLDLTNTDNQFVASLFTTLAESYSFGQQVHRIMVIDAITLQESTRRGLEVDPAQFDARRALYLNQQTGAGGALPATFDTDYARFLEALTRYTGMTEEEFLRIVRARVLYSQLKTEMSQSPEASPPSGVANVGKEVEDMVVTDYNEAATIAARLRAGETMAAVMTSLGYTATSEQTSRVLRYSDKDVTAEVITAAATADNNEVIGPFAVSNGWYVGRVLGDVNDTLSPADLDALRENYFLNWVESKMDDPSYVEDYDNWVEHTPQEPLPRDVSPLLRDEYVKVPEEQPDPFDELLGNDEELTVTPEATPGSEG